MKYLKYFEGFGPDEQDKLNTEKFLTDPIVKEIFRQSFIQNIKIYFNDAVNNAIWLYTHKNSGPLSDYMNNLLREINYGPSSFISIDDPTYDQLSGESKQIYSILTKTDICKTILGSPDAFKTLSIIKEKDINLFNYIKDKADEDTINTGSDMGDLGFK